MQLVIKIVSANVELYAEMQSIHMLLSRMSLAVAVNLYIYASSGKRHEEIHGH